MSSRPWGGVFLRFSLVGAAIGAALAFGFSGTFDQLAAADGASHPLTLGKKLAACARAALSFGVYGLITAAIFRKMSKKDVPRAFAFSGAALSGGVILVFNLKALFIEPLLLLGVVPFTMSLGAVLSATLGMLAGRFLLSPFVKAI